MTQLPHEFTDIDGKPAYRCRICLKKELSGSEKLKSWQMQHLHFEDGDLDMLTCDVCKKMNPTEWLSHLALEGVVAKSPEEAN